MKTSWTSFWLAALLLLPVLAVIACWDWVGNRRAERVKGQSEPDR